MREKPQAQVSKGCLLDFKANLGWALNEPLPLALGEENKLLPTNPSCVSFCVDDIIVNKIEDKEVMHQVTHGLVTMPPEKDLEEQVQVEEYLAQGVWNLDLRTNPSQEGEDDMTTVARRQEPSLRREAWYSWGPKMREKTCQRPNEARKSEDSDLRTNPFQEGEDDTTMEAVQLQLDSISIRPIEMTSKCPEIATNLFVFERASRGHLARLNRSPDEEVMIVLHKSRGPGVQNARVEEKNARLQRKTPDPGIFRRKTCINSHA